MAAPKETSVQRTCWKCDGDVGIHDQQCPSCSAFLQDAPSGSNSFASCHLADPHAHGAPRYDHEELFSVSPQDWDMMLQEQHQTHPSKQTSPYSFPWALYLPFMVLSIGCGLLSFSLLMLLFGTDQGLVLSWSRTYMYVFAPIGAFCVYQGYRLLYYHDQN